MSRSPRRPVLWIGLGLLLFFGPMLLAQRVALSQGEPGEGDALVYLPLSWRGASKADLPTAAPLPTSESTREPSPTATIPPTGTPEPSATPTRTGEGEITGRLLSGGEPMDEGLGEGFGPGLFLLHCEPGETGSFCERVGRTSVVGEEGRYTFKNPPSLGPGEHYQVHWRNETYGDLFGLEEWLGSWYSKRITGYAEGDTYEVEDIELENLFLTGPSNGTGYQGTPWTFTWDPRPGEEADYSWVLCDCCGEGLIERETGDPRFQSPTVRQRGEYTMQTHPPGFRVDGQTQYCWYVHLEGEGGSFGQSFERWMLWFIPGLGLDAFGLTDLDPAR